MKRKIFLFLAIISVVGMVMISGCKKKETYTVTFNANGGTGTMAAQTFTEGEAQALTQNVFTYDGYIFNGWNTVQGGSGTSYTDGQTITAISDMTLFAQWEKITRGQLNGHEWVDLGLPSGTKWATCNIGANTPEGYGDYFAWGETTTKETYYWSTYRYCNGSGSTLTKYCNNAECGNNGFTDALTTLEASDDAATANWASGWRMPTQTEINELLNNCTHEWTTQNGVNGRKFIGSNGNSVFLPAAGHLHNSELRSTGSYGGYWSSSLIINNPHSAWGLYFYSDGDCGMGDGDDRDYGVSVRPVCGQ